MDIKISLSDIFTFPENNIILKEDEYDYAQDYGFNSKNIQFKKRKKKIPNIN